MLTGVSLCDWTKSSVGAWELQWTGGNRPGEMLAGLIISRSLSDFVCLGNIPLDDHQ